MKAHIFWCCAAAFHFTFLPEAFSAAPTMPAQEAATPFVHATDNVDSDSGAYKMGVESISILKTHYIVSCIPDAALNRTYEVHFKVSDPAGTVVLEAPYSYRATMVPSYSWYGVSPDYKAHKPGKWTASITVKGIGTFTTNYTILPPSDLEKADLALYEGARESAFRAFSEFWIGVSNHFGASPKESFYYTALSGPPSEAPILGLGGIQYRFAKNGVSLADRLNGIDYQGTATFYFSVFRYHEPGKGWTPWKDVNRFQNELAQVLRIAVNWFGGGELPEEVSANHQLRFSIERKDGHWRVKSDTGDLFVNDRWVVRSGNSKVNRLELAALRQLIDTATDPRRQDRVTGQDATKTRLDLGTDVTNTMRLLRGGPL